MYWVQRKYYVKLTSQLIEHCILSFVMAMSHCLLYWPAVHDVEHETVVPLLNMSGPMLAVLSFMERSTKVAVEPLVYMPPP